MSNPEVALEGAAAVSCGPYATARLKFGHGEIRVLNVDGSIKDVIRSDGSTRNCDSWFFVNQVAPRGNSVSY